ncbi:MAG: hypothetical protein Q4F67_03020 [Propionibacteriaceae bacterium]|nr:hypothetical protein [Propionibacteriaceae bacterium]
MIAAPTDQEGILNGRDRLSGSMVAHDPFTAYRKRAITSPNVVIMGAIGSGKSSLIKTCFALRPLVFERRRVMVIDKKIKDGAGEYTDLVHRYGGEPFRMSQDGTGTRLNLMDPVIYRGAGEKAQLRLLRAVAEIARGGNEPLSTWELKALRMARAGAMREAEVDGRIPTLDDLVPRLGRMDPGTIAPDPLLHDLSPASLERLHQAGVELRFIFEDALLGELAGMFDGPTSDHVALTSPLQSFDVSSLPDDGPAVPMVVTVANAWLMGTLRHSPGWHTTFVGEEGWHLIEGGGGRFMRANTKLSRSLGLSNVISLHRPGDVPLDSPGMSLLTEAQTIYLYRQDRSIDLDTVISLYDLAESNRDVLKRLGTGEHLLKIGHRREIQVQHLLSDMEAQLIDTNEAMIFN